MTQESQLRAHGANRGWADAAEKKGKSDLGTWGTAVPPPRIKMAPSVVLGPGTLPLLPPAPSSQGMGLPGSIYLTCSFVREIN